VFWSYIALFQLLWWFEQIWQRIFKLIQMRVLYLFSIKFRKFWHTARLSRTNRHKVIKSENSPFFGPPCITYTSHQDKAGSFSIHNINQASTKLYKRLFYIADKHFTSKKTNGKNIKAQTRWQKLFGRQVKQISQARCSMAKIGTFYVAVLHLPQHGQIKNV